MAFFDADLPVKNDLEKQIDDVKREVEATRLDIDNVGKQVEKIKDSINDRKTWLEKAISLLAGRKATIN